MDRFIHRSERNVPSLDVSLRLGGYLKSSLTLSYAPDSHVIRNLPFSYSHGVKANVHLELRAIPSAFILSGV
jgi:hypothetical protein